MVKYIFFLSFFICLFLFSQSKILSFYNPIYIDEKIEIDGYLNENAWKISKRDGNFYKYWQPKPIKGELNTEFIIFYNEKGLYFASINYDENIENIKATRKMRDDPELWTDDCNEIYFDPEGKGVGYLRYVVNFLGTQGDERRIDTANTDASWNHENWIYKTSKGKNYWIVESFFPWNDVFKKPEEGDIWMFNLVRYSFSTGKFRGVSWSCGGSYNSPDKFGYLYFSKKEVDLNKIGEVLSKYISPPWELPCKGGILICKEKGKYKFLKNEEIFNENRIEIEKLIKEIDILQQKIKNDQLSNKFLKMRDEFTDKIKGEITHEKIKDMNDLLLQFNNLYWDLKIEEILINVKEVR
jgi:hypothetical protein